MMTAEAPPVAPIRECRVQAVFALFRGASVREVSTQYRIGRSDLYKLRARALAALREVLNDRSRGPKQPHNRLAPHREAGVMAGCQRHPTLSSYDVRERLGDGAPTVRTIQRIRRRYDLARLPKRAPATRLARRLTSETVQRAESLIQERPYLGPERMAWDL